LLDDSSYKNGSFDVPRPAPIIIPSQQVLLPVDETHPVQVLIGDVDAHSASMLAAHLDITPMIASSKVTKSANAGAKIKSANTGAKAGGAQSPPDTVKGGPISVPAQSMTLDTTNHVLTVTFPNLSKLGIKGLAKGADNRIIIERIPATCSPGRICPKVTVGTLTPVWADIKAPTGLKLVAGSNAVVAKSGAGTLPIIVSGTPSGGWGSASLTVTGANVTSVTTVTSATTNKALTLGQDGSFLLSADGLYTIALTNLTPGMMATISIQGFKDSKGATNDGSNPVTATFTAVSESQSTSKGN
jgi:hypothetical protein